MKDMISQIREYIPFNEQEAQDRIEMLDWLMQDRDIYVRSCRAAHMTASAWVVSSDRQYVLMAYHNLYQSWAWLGGHADGEKDLLSVARREVTEESGVEHIRAVTEEIFSLEVLNVEGHEKRGAYVPSHLHLNVTYLFEADMDERTRAKADENSAVGWIHVDDLEKMVSEPWMMKRIYSKLRKKAASI